MPYRVLIISPHFPPVNAADHQRVRMSLPYFQKFGWKPTVLTVAPHFVNGVYDPLLQKTVPKETEIISTPALPTQLTQCFGLGTLGWRALPYLAKAGNQLLAARPFDLIYFSTTAFPTLSLAAPWYKKFRIPYVIDFQDPWLSDYHKRTDTPPPGGRLKYGLNQFFARIQEPKALRHVSQIISVSPKYPQVLCDRYPWLKPQQCSELPFGAPQSDFDLLPLLSVKQQIFDPQDGFRHWVYVGRGGTDMSVALRLLFAGIQQLRQQSGELRKPTKLHFIGTSYAPADRAVETIRPIAEEFNLADIVEERTQRIPYFEAIKALTDSDAILLIGSDDPSYTASKLYPCILAKKPILAIFHQQSSVVSILQQCKAGQAVTFDGPDYSADTLSSMATKIKWLQSLPQRSTPKTNWPAFEPYTAREMTRKQCEIFDRCIAKT
ncbi:MAG: hypothetical protein WA885_21190 [Phormidesmis sp.]